MAVSEPDLDVRIGRLALDGDAVAPTAAGRAALADAIAIELRRLRGDTATAPSRNETARHLAAVIHERLERHGGGAR